MSSTASQKSGSQEFTESYAKQENQTQPTSTTQFESKIPHIPNESHQVSIKQDSEVVEEQQNLTKKVSNKGGIVNLFKTYIGSGILALPFSFNEAGYLYSTGFLVTLCIVVYYINTLLVKVGEKVLKPGQSYSDIAEKLLPKKLAFVMKMFLVFSCMTCCISYVIFFVTFFEHALGDSIPKIGYLALALLIICPITMITDIAGLVKYSFLSNAIVLLTILSIIIKNMIDIFSDMDQDLSPWNLNKNNTMNLQNTSMIIGVAIFAFDASYVIMGIRESMKKPEHFVSKVLSVTTCLVGIMYLLIACTSVLAKGHDMEEIVLFAFDGTYFTILQMLYAVALALTYPIFFCTAAKIMENKEGAIGKMIDGKRFKRVLFRILVTLVVVGVAFLVPRFAIVINLFGSITGAASQFGFPLFAYYAVFKDKMHWGQKGLNLLILCIGLLGCGLGVHGSIKALI